MVPSAIEDAAVEVNLGLVEGPAQSLNKYFIHKLLVERLAA